MKLVPLEQIGERIESDMVLIDTGADVKHREFTIAPHARVGVLLLSREGGSFDRHFILESGSHFRCAGIYYRTDIDAQVYVDIRWSEVNAVVWLLALALGGANLDVSGVWHASPGCLDTELRIDQTNILLGDGSRVRGRPVLEVETDSITGGHSCRIHQIPIESLFYLQSHGVPEASATELLISGEIQRHLDLVGIDQDESGALLSEITTSLFSQIWANPS